MERPWSISADSSSCYNKNVLDESTMTPVSERSPYNGLLSRIWELNYR